MRPSGSARVDDTIFASFTIQSVLSAFIIVIAQYSLAQVSTSLSIHRFLLSLEAPQSCHTTASYRARKTLSHALDTSPLINISPPLIWWPSLNVLPYILKHWTLQDKHL